MKSGLIFVRLSAFLLVFYVFFARTTAFALNLNSDINLPISIEQVLVIDVNTDRDESAARFSEMPGTELAPSAITLVLTQDHPGIATIKWSNSPPGLPGTYYVERKALSSATWDTLKQVPYTSTLEYIDTITFPYCNPEVFSYRVRFKPVSGPEDMGGPADLTLSDMTSPANVQDAYVSLVQTNSGFNPRLSWTKITNDSISGYVIQRSSGFNWPIIGNAPSDSSGFNDQTASDVCDNSFKYIILTIDRCGNRSAPDYKLFVQTVKLEAQQPGQCDKVARLSWNKYKEMPGGLAGYKIYRGDGTAPPMEIDTKDTSYSDNFSFVQGHTYLYSVKAYSNSGLFTSSSCQVVWPYNGALIPEVYIAQVSVEADRYIRVRYSISPPSTVIKLVLERSDNGTSDFQAVDSLLVTGGYVPVDHYIDDTTADVHAQSYYYRLVAYDDCGGKTPSMNISQSIWLQCSSSQTENTLNWNSYQSWLQGIESYKVFRIVDGQPVMGEPFGPFDPTTVTFPDPLTGIGPTSEVCYWVVAYENPQNPYLINAESKSNTCCILKAPILFMPNAFYPEGKNKVLRPVPTPAFVDPQSFKMTIFSRWGQQLFETTNMAKGWDGSINGQFAPAGLYIYILTYKSLEGKDYSKRGTALLVR